jgi:hypothetical protein
MTIISRLLAGIFAAAVLLSAIGGTSRAGLDSELSLVDGQDGTLRIQQ